MKIEQEECNNFLLVKPHGTLDTVDLSSLKEYLDRLVESGKAFIIDLSNLNFVSSSGLRVLLQTANAMKESKRKFVTIVPQEDMYEVFELSGFTRLFPVANNLQDAIAKL